MTELEFIKHYGKNVKVTFKDGTTLTGFCCSFTRAVDNTSNIASISLETDMGLIEVLQSEVNKIIITP